MRFVYCGMRIRDQLSFNWRFMELGGCGWVCEADELFRGGGVIVPVENEEGGEKKE